MASTLPFACSLAAPVRASSGSSRKPCPNDKKPGSSTWWAPLFGWSSSPDYIANLSTTPTVSTNGGGVVADKDSGFSGPDQEPGQPRSRFSLGCFTEEKAKQLRRQTAEGSTFHDIMYHSAIASRLAYDRSGRPKK